ncbi:MAG: hypothetical protein IKT40_01345 [Bacilli bacterium]|nr:hypothetical protein [Bacilli bacterium]
MAKLNRYGKIIAFIYGIILLGGIFFIRDKFIYSLIFCVLTLFVIYLMAITEDLK